MAKPPSPPPPPAAPAAPAPRPTAPPAPIAHEFTAPAPAPTTGPVQYDGPPMAGVLAAGANQFLPWATSSTANVMPLANYTNSGGQLNGVSAGIADPTIINRAIRQATFIAAGLAQFTANAGYTVNDDGNLTNFVTNLTNALHVSVSVPPFASNATALAGTDTSSMISPASLSYVISNKALLLTGGTITGNLAVNGAFTASSVSATGAGSFGTLAVSGGTSFAAGSIAAAAIGAGLTNAQQANMAAGSIKGNPGGAAAPPQDTTIAAMMAAAGIVVPTYAHFYTQTSDTLAQNGWTIRSLATQAFNNIPGCALNPSSHQITLNAGTYRLTGSASAYATAVATLVEMKLRIQNVTSGSPILAGQNYYSGASTSVPDGITASIDGIVVLGAASTIELDSWQNNNLTSGGVALGTGVADIFANLVITKIA